MKQQVNKRGIMSYVVTQRSKAPEQPHILPERWTEDQQGQRRELT